MEKVEKVENIEEVEKLSEGSSAVERKEMLRKPFEMLLKPFEMFHLELEVLAPIVQEYYLRSRHV